MTPEELQNNYYQTCEKYLSDNDIFVNIGDMTLINSLMTLECKNSVTTIVKWNHSSTQPTEDQLLSYNLCEILHPYKMIAIRSKRNLLLTESDKYMFADFPITEVKRNELLIYRQNLRLLPKNIVDVFNPIYPTFNCN
jgi:hypothetical protein